jgi:hypothetical protein
MERVDGMLRALPKAARRITTPLGWRVFPSLGTPHILFAYVGHDSVVLQQFSISVLWLAHKLCMDVSALFIKRGESLFWELCFSTLEELDTRLSSVMPHKDIRSQHHNKLSSFDPNFKCFKTLSISVCDIWAIAILVCNAVMAKLNH